LTAGDPSLAKTLELILELEKAGADMIEIGVPFSDPTATVRSSRPPHSGR
jgi:tryptophan synthase alpha chain